MTSLLLGGLGGMLGGAVSLLTLATRSEWLLNGAPAHPTPAGLAVIGLYGALCGGVFGTLVVHATRGKWAGLGDGWQVALPLGLGMVVGLAGVFLCIPFHAPIPLALD